MSSYSYNQEQDGDWGCIVFIISAIMMVLLLLILSCAKEPVTYCFDCHATDYWGLPISETFCGYSDEEIQSVVNFWEDNEIELKCIKTKRPQWELTLKEKHY